MINHKNIFFSFISHYLPEQIIDNEQIIAAKNLKMKASWIETRLGITHRRWASADQAASDLVVEALKKKSALEAPLILSTISPDYLTPSTSSEIKRKMNWSDLSVGIDISAACAGFIFALEMAALRISAGSTSSCYACASEVRSRFLDMSDRRTVFLFGDAAACALLTDSKENFQGQLLWTSTYTSSKGPAEILVPAGGSKKPIGEEELKNSEHKIRMIDGGAIEDTIYTQLIERVQYNLKLRQENFKDYDFIVFHQGNSTLLKNVCAQIGFNENQTHINFNTYGNSSSASLGVALSEAIELKKIKPGSKILLVAMGAGYHLGIAGLSWNV